MSTPPPSLGALLAAVTAACTPADRDAAVSALFVAARPVLIPVCDAVLQRAPGAHWHSAEDLAQDVLVDTLPALQRGACPTTTNNGLVRFLRTVATRRLISAARPQTGVTPFDLAEVVLALHAANAVGDDADDPDAQRRAEIRQLYNVVLGEVPEAFATTWRVVVEQELPKTAAAAALGIDRGTVHRHVTAVRTHLASRLSAFAP